MKKKFQLSVNIKTYNSTRCLIETVFFIGQLPNENPFTSPLSTALCQAKSPPSAYPSLSFFGRSPASLCASYLSFITEHFRPQNLLQLFFFLRQSPPLIPDSAPPLFKPLSLSHSQSDHAWMRHGCANASSLPICLGAFVCQCESGGKPLLWRPEWYISPNPGWCWVRWSFVGITAFTWESENKLIMLS